jgi:hypothetical protein
LALLLLLSQAADNISPRRDREAERDSARERERDSESGRRTSRSMLSEAKAAGRDRSPRASPSPRREVLHILPYLPR